MFKHKNVSQIPPTVPLLKPLSPPEHIIKLCKQQLKNRTKQSAQNNKTLQIIEEQDYKKLYEQKCQELILEITRSKKQEQELSILQSKNSQLQTQIKRMQEQRWNGYDYSRLSARGRSKSQKRVVPIIEVKLPVKQSSFNFAEVQEEKPIHSERQHYQRVVAQYQRQIQECRLQIKQLKEKVQEKGMKPIQTERSIKVKNSSSEEESKKQAKGTLYHSNSPLKNQGSEVRVQKIKTPHVGQFSPDLTYQVQTVKKDQSYAESVEQQLKKLKNELLYKDLLLTKLREQKNRENDVLKRHLLLSNQQSRKMADHTAIILEKFKNEIVVLWKQLQAEKSKNSKLQSLTEKDYLYKTRERQLKSMYYAELQPHSQSLVQLLKARRNQKLQ